MARAAGIPAEAGPSVAGALDRSLAIATGGPLRVLICGSLYLAGTVLVENG
jgi:dihydrofolate synthase/folylpolyglutamate synthase